MSSFAPALAGGALIGLAASIALLGHGRIAGVSGVLGRAFIDDGGRAFRLAFLIALIAVGAVAAQLAPHALGAQRGDVTSLACGGLLVGIGATLGNGCTSGHGVCGLSRGSRRSLVSVLTFMVTAAITVALVGARR